MFCFFFDYPKTETRNNSEKNYINVSLHGRCSSIFWKKFYSQFNNKTEIFFSSEMIFCKNAIFEKSEKIPSDSPKYYANFKYIIKVRTHKNALGIKKLKPTNIFQK